LTYHIYHTHHIYENDMANKKKNPPKKAVGRPAKDKSKLVVAKTLSFKPVDIKLIETIKTRLAKKVVMGKEKAPLPTGMDIHRIALMSLDKLSDQQIYNLYLKYKSL
jgi:hypothetical protein